MSALRMFVRGTLFFLLFPLFFVYIESGYSRIENSRCVLWVTMESRLDSTW